MTVKELIGYVKDLPPDTIVKLAIDNPFEEFEVEQVSVDLTGTRPLDKGVVYLSSTR